MIKGGIRCSYIRPQIFNLRILCEKYFQHLQDLYHVFIDFKKAFDRVWHAALWRTMKKNNISANLFRVIKNLHDKATSAIFFNSSIGDHEGTVSIGGRTITNLRFADDIGRLAGEEEGQAEIS